MLYFYCSTTIELLNNGNEEFLCHSHRQRVPLSVLLERPALREGLVTLLLGMSVVLVIMNTMMFNLALPDVSVAFDLSATSTSWIVTGYSIVFAISSITYSRLSDFVPIRKLFIIGMLSLSLAAIAGFFSDSYLFLLIVRIIQASGAGSIPALSLVLISRYVPMERRGKAMATVMSAASLGLGLGPVAGGAIMEYLGWHYLFVVTAITILLVPFFAILIPKEKPAKGTFDAFGHCWHRGDRNYRVVALPHESILDCACSGIVALILFVIRIRTATSHSFYPPYSATDRT